MVRLLLSLLSVARGQMFEIPAEMAAQMFGGGMGGGGRRKPATEWPKTENPEIAPEYNWIVNTEWKGKTSKYLLLRDGVVESDLKECQQEDQCLWAANNERILINTPTLKVVKFTIDGLDKVDRKKLEDKDEAELKKITLTSEKASKSGKKSQLNFGRLAQSEGDDNQIIRDLYKVLDVAEEAPQSEIKSKYRRLSVQHHPDKGGDPQLFNDIREAYEILSDQDKRRYYDIGGVQLVKNIDLAWKEVEGQKAQLDAQLSQVPKNHPQRKMAEQQVEQQKRQFEQSHSKHEIEKKLRSDDIEVMVPVSAAELYNGVKEKTFNFKRLVICRGCRAEPDADHCKECGRCPPEKVQVPKYANTPFGKQVVAVKEKEQESLERCREVLTPIPKLKIPKGAPEGHTLRYVSDIGHMTPGKMPGRIHLKVQRGDPDDTYSIAEADLHTVLHITLEQALFGFVTSWTHLGDETVTLGRYSATPGEVVKIKKKGLVASGGGRGDLYVRLDVEMPKVDGASLELKDTSRAEMKAKLSREANVELREGAAWRRWVERENAKPQQLSSSKEEL